MLKNPKTFQVLDCSLSGRRIGIFTLKSALQIDANSVFTNFNSIQLSESDAIDLLAGNTTNELVFRWIPGDLQQPKSLKFKI